MDSRMILCAVVAALICGASARTDCACSFSPNNETANCVSKTLSLPYTCEQCTDLVDNNTALDICKAAIEKDQPACDSVQGTTAVIPCFGKLINAIESWILAVIIIGSLCCLAVIVGCCSWWFACFMFANRSPSYAAVPAGGYQQQQAPAYGQSYGTK
eukprot:m.111347 g.111347  ORF g.111347 m.111347 type:complete len:158 (-) comp14057_c1_seq1:2107-2580(-)